MNAKTGFGFEQFPERADIQAEAHARPPLAIEAETAEVWNWVLGDLPEAPAAWQAPYDQFCRHKVIELPGGQLRIERHTEFVSITWLGAAPPDGEAQDVIALCPGRQLAGAHVLIRPSGWSALPDVFGTGRIFGGAARFAGVEVATDFQVGADEVVTYTLSGSFDDAFARGRLVKRLIDLETYRMAALLGLPAVRQAMPELQSLEARAGAAMRSLSSAGDEDLGGSIRELSALLAEVGALREGIRYRMALQKPIMILSRISGEPGGDADRSTPDPERLCRSSPCPGDQDDCSFRPAHFRCFLNPVRCHGVGPDTAGADLSGI